MTPRDRRRTTIISFAVSLTVIISAILFSSGGDLNLLIAIIAYSLIFIGATGAWVIFADRASDAVEDFVDDYYSGRLADDDDDNISEDEPKEKRKPKKKKYND